MRVRLGVIALLACTVVLAGCGGRAAERGGGPAGGAAAGVVPADVALYVSLDTDFDGEEWRQAEDLLGKFPDGDQLLDRLLADLQADDLDFEQDVKPALGREVALVVQDVRSAGPSFVGLTQPRDRQKFDELAAQSDAPLVTEDVEGWVAFAEDQATIDRFKRAQGARLADSDEFAAAMDGLEAGIGDVYVSGAALEQIAKRDRNAKVDSLEALLPERDFPTIGMTIRAEENGGRVDGNLVFGGDLAERGVPAPYEAELPSEVPDGVLAYFSFHDFERGFSHVRDALAQIDPEFARLPDDELAPLFANEGALYVRRDSLLPELTLVTQVADEGAAVRTLDHVVEGLRGSKFQVPRPERVEVAGVQARRLALEAPLALYYGAFDGKLVVTTAPSGIADLRKDGGHFADQDGFETAKEQARMPAQTSGFAYFDVEGLVPLLMGYLGVGGNQVPPDVAANLEPLQSLVAYGTTDGKTMRFSAFLGVE